MLAYAWPLVISGFAGIVNEMLDRASMKYLLQGSPSYRLEQLGIYGANYKLTMLISMFTQAYRYAAEPFFFRNAGTGNALQTQADAAKWYTITASGGMLAVLLYLDIAKHFIDARYHVGLAVVPILSVANVLLGVYYNFSVWYRLKDKTAIGAGIAIVGAGITVLTNFLLIPRIGYMGAAWATLICYTFMAVATWYTGRVYYPVAYPLGRMFFYVAFALALFVLLSGVKVLMNSQILVFVVATGLFLLFILAVWFLELRKPKSV
jgi:O-antigen/teichoic acid export membrane protein